MRILLKVSAVLSGLVLCLLLIAWYFVTVPVWTDTAPRPTLTDAKKLHQHVIVLSEEIGGRPHNRPDRLDQAADYIFDQFSAFGTPRFQEFKAQDQTYKNIILRLKGNSTCDDQLYVVGAHYDTEGNKPGADDNASGVAGLIELAHAIRQHALPCDVELVAYTLEEPPNFRTPNMGSHHHARSLKDQNTPVALMVSLEMIGYFSDEPDSQHYPIPAMSIAYGNRGNFIGIVGDMDSRSPIHDFRRSFTRSGRIETKAISAPSFVPGIDFSDHQNYLKFDYPAIMITDTSFYRNAHYHQPTDTHDTLNYEKMAAVVDSVLFALQDVMAK